MIGTCSSFVAILSALTIVFAASQPAAALVNIPQIARAADPVILVTGTRVEDMTPQMRTAYIRGIQEELAAAGWLAANDSARAASAKIVGRTSDMAKPPGLPG